MEQPVERQSEVTSGAAADPIADLFVAQLHRPDHLVDINPRALSPFQRALLAIDGTVTKFIEAYTMETVDIRPLGQQTRKLATDHPWLEVPRQTPVVVREVALEGRHTREIYAYALSLVVADRLSEPARRALEVEGAGLGRILLAERTENYREILWWGKETPKTLPNRLKHLRGHEFLSRTYRIIVDGKPVMLINEMFPMHGRDGLPHHH